MNGRELVEEGKHPQKNVRSISGLLAKERVIQKGLFSESISFCRLVVTILPRCVCVSVSGENSYSMTSIFCFIIIHEYANEIILYMTIG